MGPDLIQGQTPIEPEEYAGLKIKSITTQAELNEFEQNNIENALQWLMRKNIRPDVIFSELFIREVHNRMFQDVWKWAGDFRTTNKNIGVDKHQIRTELKKLTDDIQHWTENKSFSETETAIRFKHRLVKIHLFPNGNGRHSRIMADVVITKYFGKQEVSWGNTNLYETGKARSRYIEALKNADKGNYKALIDFATG